MDARAVHSLDPFFELLQRIDDILNSKKIYDDFWEEMEYELGSKQEIKIKAVDEQENLIDIVIFNQVSDPGFMALPAWSKLKEDQPKAFISYLLFDNNNKLVDFNFEQMPLSAEIPDEPAEVEAHEHALLQLPQVKVQKEGYIFIYVSNMTQQNMEVYFDDLHVTHHFSDIVSGGDYYPYGLEIKDRQVDRDPYRFKYQGQFSEKDGETGWNHFKEREYDSEIGRWITTDPDRIGYSQYSGMGNNPIRFGDPDGGSSDDIIVKGANNSSITIKTELDLTIETKVDFNGQHVYDATKIFIGFDTGISANASVGSGIDGTVSIMSGMFLGGNFAYYPYDYLVLQGGQNLSIPEFSISAFKNIVIGVYQQDDLSKMTPSTIEGAFTYYGGSVTVTTPGAKVGGGIGYQLGVTDLWKIHEFGGIVTGGVGASIVGAQFKTNRHFEAILGQRAKDFGTGCILLNRNVQPTSQRSWSEILIAPFLGPFSR